MSAGNVAVTTVAQTMHLVMDQTRTKRSRRRQADEPHAHSHRAASENSISGPAISDAYHGSKRTGQSELDCNTYTKSKDTQLLKSNLKRLISDASSSSSWSQAQHFTIFNTSPSSSSPSSSISQILFVTAILIMVRFFVENISILQ